MFRIVSAVGARQTGTFVGTSAVSLEMIEPGPKAFQGDGRPGVKVNFRNFATIPNVSPQRPTPCVATKFSEGWPQIRSGADAFKIGGPRTNSKVSAVNVRHTRKSVKAPRRRIERRTFKCSSDRINDN